MGKRDRYLNQVVYDGQIISLYVCPTPDDFFHFEDEIKKSLDYGQQVICAESMKSGIEVLAEKIGIPAKILRLRLKNYSLQAALNMGYDGGSDDYLKRGSECLTDSLSAAYK